MLMISGRALTARPTRVAGVALVIASVALSHAVLPTDAAAALAHSSVACRQWNISGRWTSAASNNYHVTFAFIQRGQKLHGVATNPPAEATIAGYAKGKLTGTLKGSHVNFVVVWSRSTVDHIIHHGDYYGTVSARTIVGLGKDLSVRGLAPASFSASGPTRCLKH
jgi:hypothetical protein